VMLAMMIENLVQSFLSKFRFRIQVDLLA